jgi:hypothetical protein
MRIPTRATLDCAWAEETGVSNKAASSQKKRVLFMSVAPSLMLSLALRELGSRRGMVRPICFGVFRLTDRGRPLDSEIDGVGAPQDLSGLSFLKVLLSSAAARS